LTKKAAKQSIEYSRQCGDNLKAIIAEVKVRQHLTDEGVAKMLDMPLPTFKSRKGNPGRFRLEDIWRLCQVLEIPDNQRKSIVVMGGSSESI